MSDRSPSNQSELAALCCPVHKLPPSNTLSVHKLNLVPSDRLDFAAIKTCDLFQHIVYFSL